MILNVAWLQIHAKSHPWPSTWSEQRHFEHPCCHPKFGKSIANVTPGSEKLKSPIGLKFEKVFMTAKKDPIFNSAIKPSISSIALLLES